MQPQPRSSSICGVARALVITMGPADAADILVAQFGWDVAVHALARLEGTQPRVALYDVMARLLTDEAAPWSTGDEGHVER